MSSLILGILGVYYIYNSNSNLEKSSVDLSYESWDKTYPFENSKISNEGDFMRIISRDFYKEPSATLTFEKSKKITLNFKIRTPELSMVKSSGILIKSGETILCGIINKGRFDALIVDNNDHKYFALLQVLDRNWHDVKIELEILPLNSKISITFDGIKILDDLYIKISVNNIDTIHIYGSGGRNVPNITDFMFKSIELVN